MLKKLSGIVILVLFAFISYFYTEANANNIGSELSNNYFSFTMPDEMQGIYSVIKKDNGIFISEKTSKESNKGGFAFAFKIFKNPQDYADSDGYRKIGELTDKTGVLYDMVLIRPDEVKYGDGEKIAENYNKLYNLAENLDIKGINGNIYNKNKGMKGEDLYSDILKKYKKVFDENRTTDRQYKNANINTAYYYFFKPNEKLSDKIGYVYYDINSDGVDELIIGKITRGKLKGLVYDLYTMVDRKPQLVFSGCNINKYFICNNNFICNEKSANKGESQLTVFGLDKNSTRMYTNITFIYNSNKKKSSPGFIRYGVSDKKEYVPEKYFNERKSFYSKKYNRFNFIPFNRVNQI